MAQTLGNIAVGNLVKLRSEGTLEDYFVIHQGKPSGAYDESCNGTWLLSKDIRIISDWHSSENNDYENSAIRDYLENTLFNRIIDENIRAVTKQVRLPYCAGTGSDANVKSGAAGLPSRYFLLSFLEVGGVSSVIGASPEGAKLAYFIEGNDNAAAQQRRIAYRDGVSCTWWLRSPYFRAGSTGGAIRTVWACKSTGSISAYNCHTYDFGVRPALVLPQNLFVLDSGEVITNRPPAVPLSINVPEFVKGGGGLSVSWGAATDPDGNLAGYRLERSVNGGGFTQIFEGNALSFTDNITYGWKTVAYRVRAYDTVGAVSDYVTGPTRTIFNNSAPTAPPSITVPDEIKGGKQFSISWGAATDVDGNLSGYQLERSLNGGGFEQIYLGAERSVKDTVVKGTSTAAYRVRAYDAENAWSGYTTSGTRTVINNTPPVINGTDGDLGLKNEPFSVPYMVLDADGDTIAITERLDGKVLRTFEAGADQEYSITFETSAYQQILNETHALVVTARDNQGAEAVRSWTWSKNITSMSITKRLPIEVVQMPEMCLVNINGAIPAGATLTVEVCNNGFDGTPSWEDCSQAVAGREAYKFSNSSKTGDKWGFNFRVKVARNNAQGPCHISCVSGNIGGDQEPFILVLDGGNASGRT